jgi:hypothetical protein
MNLLANRVCIVSHYQAPKVAYAVAESVIPSAAVRVTNLGDAEKVNMAVLTMDLFRRPKLTEASFIRKKYKVINNRVNDKPWRGR